MPSDNPQRTDPARILALLWRDAGPVGSSPGPRPTLSVDRVVDAAVTLADAHGLDAVTIRRVARALHVAPMSVYTYVPEKDALLELMLDAVYLRMVREPSPDPGWRARVAAIAHDNRALYERHPWVAELPTSRPPLGPGLMAKYQYELEALEGLGLDDVEMDAALTHVLGFVDACARAAADARAIRRDSSMSDAEWWAAHAPLLTRVFDPERFPLAARVGAAAGEAHQAAYNPDHAYTFGLARLLDGLGVLLDGKDTKCRTPRA